MTFVAISVNREQLALLSRFLVTIFPGCTIYQGSDPMRALLRLSNQKVEAVFEDADTCANMMDTLSKHNGNTQICLLCKQDAVPQEETTNFHGVVSYPITEQQIRTTLQGIAKAM